MLDEWRPLLCPFDVKFAKAMFYFSLFLPTTLPPEKYDKGYKYVLLYTVIIEYSVRLKILCAKNTLGDMLRSWNLHDFS